MKWLMKRRSSLFMIGNAIDKTVPHVSRNQIRRYVDHNLDEQMIFDFIGWICISRIDHLNDLAESNDRSENL